MFLRALGRDLISELKGAGVKLNNVSSVGETNVVRLTGMNKEDLTIMASDELSRLSSLVKSIDNVLQEVNWADSVKTNYKNLSVVDPIKLAGTAPLLSKTDVETKRKKLNNKKILKLKTYNFCYEKNK